MDWTTPWLGKRYVREGRGPEAYDCLGFFMAVQRAEFGRAVDYGLVAEGPEEVVARQVHFADGEDWQEISEARLGCALLFRRGRGFHIGVALDDQRVLHCANEQQGSVIEPFRTRKWGGRLDGIYEWAGHDR